MLCDPVMSSKPSAPAQSQTTGLHRRRLRKPAGTPASDGGGPASPSAGGYWPPLPPPPVLPPHEGRRNPYGDVGGGDSVGVGIADRGAASGQLALYGFPSGIDRHTMNAIIQDLTHHAQYMRTMASNFDQMTFALRMMMSSRGR